MPRFLVRWKGISYGESYVTAENEDEALEKAQAGEDKNFAECGEDYPVWDIDEIVLEDEEE